MLISYINLFIAIFGFVVTLASMLGPVLISRQLRHESRYVEFIFGLNLIYLLAVLLEACYAGKQGAFAYMVMNVTNFLQYLLLYVLSNLVALYIGYRIKENGLTSFNVRPFLYIYGIAYALLAANLANGMYYQIDYNNIYHRGPLFALSQIMGMICHFVVFYIFQHYKKYMTSVERRMIMPFIFLPIIGIFLQAVGHGINFMIISTTCCCLLLTMDGMNMWRYYHNLRANKLEQMRVNMRFGKISPEFVYNTLADISQLCIQDPEEASEIIDLFADYLRKSMNDNVRAGLSSFDEEFEHLQNYFSLEYMRYGDDFGVVYDIEESDFQLPVHVLGEITEYLIHHCMMQSEDYFQIYVKTYAKNRKYYVELSVKDYFIDQTEHVQNTEETQEIEDIKVLLRIIPGSHLDYRSSKEEGIKFTITIPKTEAE
ncbi:MAG: histidine kinase [Eubacteriales bacterium]|nr:histidine kinase [Eubacteriales bacterium]